MKNEHTYPDHMISDKNSKIEWLSRFPNENPHPVLRISKGGELLYFNRSSLRLLKLSKSSPTQPLDVKWQDLAREVFERNISKTIEWEVSGHYFSVTFSPEVEHNYVNVYGFDITSQKQTENYLLDHNETLGQLAAGKPLKEILDGLSRKIQKHQKGLISSILILDKSKKFLYYGSAPSLPEQYVRETRKVFLGPKQGSCGTAAYEKRTIVVENISTDPLWENFKHIPLEYGLRACWSTPIIDSENNVLGTFAAYYSEPRKPKPEEIEMIKSYANFAALAIKNNNVTDDLKNYAQELERSNEELNSFAYIASHDLQEPLRKISIFSDRLKEAKSSLNERHQDYLSRMGNAAQRMKMLINALLELSQVNSKTKIFKRVDIADAICDIKEDLGEKTIETQGKITMGYLPCLEADPFQMRQLFQNLIENALKYHRPDAPPVVHIDSQPNENGCWDISVHDNGIGLDEKFSERIFVPLERLHGKSSFEGTGIGLAICKKIVSHHGGSISVKSQQGKGTKFTVTLPKRQSPST